MNPDSKVHGANMGPTFVLSVPGGPHVGLMNLAIWEVSPSSAVPDWFHAGKLSTMTNWSDDK